MARPSKAHFVTPRNALTAEHLRSILTYNKKTGIFTWKRSHARINAGDQAGYVNKRDGRRFISIYGVRYASGRLAWLYVTGKWPAEYIDHKNGKQIDSWKNLREASHPENQRNMKKRTGSKSPYKGVKKHRNRWQARITYDGTCYYLGLFTTALAAHQAYKKAARELHKEFARFK